MTPAVFDASNLHVGGAIQVAASFFAEATSGKFDDIFPWLGEARFLASSQVMRNLSRDTRLEMYHPGHLKKRADVSGLKHDSVWFDVFGSAVQRRVPCIRLAGFADVTSIYRVPLSSPASEVRRRLRGMISRRNFRGTRHLIVEAEHVADRLVVHGFERERISVVPNCYHPIFNEEIDTAAVDRWKERLAEGHPARPRRFLYVARAYAHKNHNFLGEVGRALESRLGAEQIKFIVTLTQNEWAGRSDDFRRHSINIGPVNIADLPALYTAVDGVVFPSLLECFSVTPLEALRMGKPLIAGDHSFVRTTVEKHAIYCAPDAPGQWADSILKVVDGGPTQSERVRSGVDFATSMPDSQGRALQYLKIVDRYLSVDQAKP